MAKKNKLFILYLLWLLLFAYLGTIARDSVKEFWSIVPEVFSLMIGKL